MGTPNMWVEALWLTRKEAVTIEDPNGEMVTREISVGMTVKSDKSARSENMYHSLKKALSRIIEEEKEEWLDSHLMKKSSGQLRQSIAEGEGDDRTEG